MAAFTWSQLYGAEAPSGPDTVTAVRPGDGESASTFDIATYTAPDKVPAFVILVAVAVLAGVRVLWERAK